MNIKDHFKNNKKFYIGLGVGVGIAGITYLVMRERSLGGMHIGIQRGEAECELAANSQAVNLSYSFSDSSACSATTNISTTNIYDDRKPPLSYIVKEEGTDNWWISQADTSRSTGISEPDLSNHLNYGTPLKSGRIFTRVGIAS